MELNGRLVLLMLLHKPIRPQFDALLSGVECCVPPFGMIPIIHTPPVIRNADGLLGLRSKNNSQKFCSIVLMPLFGFDMNVGGIAHILQSGGKDGLKSSHMHCLLDGHH